MKKDVCIIIPAAGRSTRMGPRGLNKPYLVWRGKSVLSHILYTFNKVPRIREIIVAINPTDRQKAYRVIKQAGKLKNIAIKLVKGGRERQDSVFNALKIVDPDSQIILVHDAARPFIKLSEIKRVIQATRRTGAAVLGQPVVDTIKRVNIKSRKISETLQPRAELWRAQTPQGFKKNILLKVYRLAKRKGLKATDDSWLVEKLGSTPVTMVPGRADNRKITVPEDMKFIKVSRP
ncbi:MAG: 2-C-methyl-D-erythritol 4-phosphate cytidylyltransferase [Planctomycetes bacterium]|nr:2-C-methyl-D-erythritol 4-phosphate cytidylyltransferase [Planctomycetota bacterium]